MKIYANPTNGWSNYAFPIDESIDGEAPVDAYGVYVTVDGERKAWLCQETEWKYDLEKKILTNGKWGFDASVISNTFIYVYGHASAYTNTTHTGELDLKDKIITGTDGKGYTIHKWSVVFDSSFNVSKINLPSSIREINGRFYNCKSIQEINFESEFVSDVPNKFMCNLPSLSNGVVRLPNLKYIGRESFAYLPNWTMDIQNVLPIDLNSLSFCAFHQTALTGNVVLTNLLTNPF